MGRLANQVKAQEWRRRLRRFEASDLTVARFCSQERVTVSSFWVSAHHSHRYRGADGGVPGLVSPWGQCVGGLA
jgi:hypothetical protein